MKLKNAKKHTQQDGNNNLEVKTLEQFCHEIQVLEIIPQVTKIAISAILHCLPYPPGQFPWFPASFSRHIATEAPS